ncbi:hypothetical protein [Oceanirhabdus seepicola]|uniref:Uncharacterized protein n=1 Tax=Oceanirhabdus seepicola TaxID=2828781 RepID=A0A9J6P2W0_9CLOT|nr:hypothetical protein [Oceanirhabdus seepicola]MCM1990526.1 hypothetical protein [Oceanirhabdus seepicola]
MKQTEDFTLRKALIITMVFVFFLTLMPSMVFAEGNTSDEAKSENQEEKDSTQEEVIKTVKGIYNSIDKELNEEEINEDLYYELTEEEIKYIEQIMPKSESDAAIEGKDAKSLSSSKNRSIREAYFLPKITAYRENYTIHMMFAGISIDGENVQIWGKNNNNHFLIKDYGDTLPGCCLIRTFDWNITDIPNAINESNIVKSYDQDFDNIGIYIRIKNGKCDGTDLTYYENFSLLEKDVFKGVNLITSFDTDNLTFNFDKTLLSSANYNTQFPAVAIQDEPFEMRLIKNSDEWNKHYKVFIKGWNEGREYQEKLDNCVNLYTWIPPHDGVFNIVVEDNKSKPVIVRKVFVRKEDNNNDDYLSIDNVVIDKSGENVEIKVDTDNFHEDNSINNSQLAVKVGEESVWSKTIKNYSDSIMDINDDIITVSETNNNFELSKGQYVIDAFVKKRFSVEYEDAVRSHYSDENFEGLFNVTATNASEDEVVNSNGFELGETYTFKISPDSEKSQGVDLSNLEFAFLIWDARGKRVIEEYDEGDSNNIEKSFTYTFRDPGEYKVYLRARVKDDSTQTQYRPNNDTWNLPNSYMDEVSMEVIIPMEETEMEISHVEITSFNKGSCTLFDQGENHGGRKINAHSKNIINISAEYDGNNDDSNRLMYKVYAIHDGIWECLTQYTVSNEIPFYPRSTGEYKLLILVKDSVSGSEQDRLELNVIAEN